MQAIHIVQRVSPPVVAPQSRGRGDGSASRSTHAICDSTQLFVCIPVAFAISSLERSEMLPPRFRHASATLLQGPLTALFNKDVSFTLSHPRSMAGVASPSSTHVSREVAAMPRFTYFHTADALTPRSCRMASDKPRKLSRSPKH